MAGNSAFPMQYSSGVPLVSPDDYNRDLKLIGDNLGFSTGPVSTTAKGDFTVTDSLIVDTNTLVVNASGYTDKVGIGTATPATLLHLESAVAPALTFIDQGTSTALIGTETTGAVFGSTALDIHFRTGMTPGDLTTGNTKLTILDNGNTGIGVTDPDSVLEVAGTTHIQGAATLDSTLTVATSLDIGSSIAVTGVLDEDDMASDSAVKLCTQQSIKKFVEDQITAEDLDFVGDSGTGSVDLDSQSLDIAGGTNVTTVAGSQTLTVNLDDNVDLAGTLDVTGATVLDTTLAVNIATPDGTCHIHTATAGTVAASVVADDLVVENSTDGGISILVPDNGTGTLVFGSPSDVIGAGLSWLHDTNLMVVGTQNTGGTLAFRVDGGFNALTIAANKTVTALSHLVIGAGTAGIDYTLTINGENNDFLATWMEDEDYLAISDDILMNTTEKIYFRDTDMSISSVDLGYMDFTAGTGFRFANNINMATNKRVFFRDADIFIMSDDDGYLDLQADTGIRVAGDTAITGNGSISGTLGVGITTPDGTCHVHTATAGAVVASPASDDLVVENNTDGGISILVPDDGTSVVNFGSPSDAIGASINWHHDNSLMIVGTNKTGGTLALAVDDGFYALTIAADKTVTVLNDFVIGAGTAGVDYTITINGETNDFLATWMEDEDYLALSDDILLNTTEKIYFRDTDISINSVDNGYMDLAADTGFRFTNNIYLPTNKRVFFRDSDIFILSSNDGYLDLQADTGIRLAGNTAITGSLSCSLDLTVTGNNILDAGGAWIDSDGSGNTTLNGNLTISGNNKIYFNDTNSYIGDPAPNGVSGLVISDTLRINVSSPDIYIGDGSTASIPITFTGSANGKFTWESASDYFEFYDDILMRTTQKIYFRDTALSISSVDDTFLDYVADGGHRFAGAVIMDTSLDINSSVVVTGVLDEDNMVSDSNVKLCTQQSIKKYVDDQVATVDTWAEVLANGNTSGATDVIIDSGQSLTVDGTTLVVNASGYTNKVGIGTATPATLLHLESAVAPALTFVDQGTSTALIGTETTGAVFGSTALDIHFRTGMTPGDLTTGNTKLTILDNGNTGVGVTDPDALLEVAGTAHIQGATTLDSTLDVTGLISANGGVTIPTTKNLVMVSDSDILVNTDKFTVAGSTGNVGIGGNLTIAGNNTIYFNDTNSYIGDAVPNGTAGLIIGDTLRVNVISPEIYIGDGASVDIPLIFSGSSAQGQIRWESASNYFEFYDDILMRTTGKIYFHDTDISIHSNADGNLTIAADTRVTVDSDLALSADGDDLIMGTGGTDTFSVSGGILTLAGSQPFIVDRKLTTTEGRIKNTTRITSADSPYTALATDHVIFANTDTLAVVVNLPAGVEGTEYKVINTGTSSKAVTLNPNGAENLIGANSAFTLNDGESLIINYNATDGWY